MNQQAYKEKESRILEIAKWVRTLRSKKNVTQKEMNISDCEEHLYRAASILIDISMYTK